MNNTREKNYSILIKKLNQLGIDTSILNEKYGEQIKIALFNTTTSTSFEGSLLEYVINILTPSALKLSEIYFTDDKLDAINKDSLIKVCLLTHISKCNMFTKGKREGTYEYAQYPYALKMGMRSVAICSECGINLTAEELEAMTILDRENDDQTKFFSSPLAAIFKMANEMTFLKIKNIKSNKY